MGRPPTRMHDDAAAVRAVRQGISLRKKTVARGRVIYEGRLPPARGPETVALILKELPGRYVPQSG